MARCHPSNPNGSTPNSVETELSAVCYRLSDTAWPRLTPFISWHPTLGKFKHCSAGNAARASAELSKAAVILLLSKQHLEVP